MNPHKVATLFFRKVFNSMKSEFCGRSKGTCKDGRLFTIHEDEDGNPFVKCFSYKLIH